MDNPIGNQENYLLLLDLAFDVANVLKGKEADDYRIIDCQKLALKLYFHASTIYHLRQGTRAPVPLSEGGSNYFDFASVAVITRSALETYLKIFEVFIEPKSDDEREYQYNIWLLSGLIIRENWMPTDPRLLEKVKQARDEIEIIRERIKKTKKYSLLSDKQKRKALKGTISGRSWEIISEKAELGGSTIKHLYSFYSSYVHSDGLSGIQVFAAETKEMQIAHIETHMSTIMMILAKMIISYSELFEESKMACKRKPNNYNLAIYWNELVKKLP